jgi:hypothetical protein
LYIRNFEIIVGVSEIADHFLTELMNSFFRFVFILAIPEFLELLGEGCCTIREAEAPARAGTYGAVLTDNPADLRRAAAEIHDKAFHLHEAACDTKGADVALFLLVE